MRFLRSTEKAATKRIRNKTTWDSKNQTVGRVVKAKKTMHITGMDTDKLT
jgi:hypothetical protein